MNSKALTKRQLARRRGRIVRDMVSALLEAGVTYEEIGAEVHCSRMTLVNWLNGAHPPRPKNYLSVRQAFVKLRERRRQMAPEKIVRDLLNNHGFSRDALSGKLGVAETTLEGWINQDRKPLGGNLRRLQEIYAEEKRAS